jgi:hypothetical protein
MNLIFEEMEVMKESQRKFDWQVIDDIILMSSNVAFVETPFSKRSWLVLKRATPVRSLSRASMPISRRSDAIVQSPLHQAGMEASHAF